MRWISNLFSRNWRNAHFALILILSILLIINGLGFNRLVSQLTLSSLYYPFFKIKSATEYFTNLSRENQRLRAALVDASVRVSRLEEAGRENVRLRSVLGFEPPVGYSLLPAEVLAVAGPSIPTTATINLGSSDGVAVNDPVISQQGLMGKIATVTESFSTVELLTDPANRVAVRIADSRELGIAKFVMPRGLIVDNVPVRGDVQPGDEVITTGLGGVYPSGLAVGTVISVVHPDDRPFADIRLAPAADFNSLDELFVLKVVKR